MRVGIDRKHRLVDLHISDDYGREYRHSMTFEEFRDFCNDTNRKIDEVKK